MKNVYANSNGEYCGGGYSGWEYPFGRDCDCAIFDKNIKLRTNLHYSDPDAGKELTVFGEEKKGLFYNYNDRLVGQTWSRGLKLAEESGKTPGTAAYYEAALNYFHKTDTVNLQHIILGCNRMTGYSYLIFGYTYHSPGN